MKSCCKYPDLPFANTKKKTHTFMLFFSGSIPTERRGKLVMETKDSNENANVETDGKIGSSDISNSKDDEYGKNVSYETDGTAVYTDPKTNYKYKWCSDKNDWIAMESPTENEHYRWCSESNKWIPKENVPSTETETEYYKWDAEKKEWIPKADGVTYAVDDDGLRTYTDKDGSVFFWDTEKKAWFPKIDDDFMAVYQMNYGYTDNTDSKDEDVTEELEEEKVVEEKISEKDIAGAKRKAQEASEYSFFLIIL